MTVVIPAPAASLLLVRDGPQGLEVLMVMRSEALDFAGGMTVFPGGRVDRRDSCHGGCAPFMARRGDHAYRIAALRELFEETGLLLGRRRGGAYRLLGERDREAIARRYRRRVLKGEADFVRLLARVGLTLAAERLVPFSHWITPTPAPKRFDTRFFLAAAPPGQRASSDGRENIGLAWRRPQDLLGAWAEGRQRLMFPTRLNLMKLAASDTVASAIAHARTTPVIPVTPEIHEGGVRRLVIPAEAGFGVTEASHDDLDPIERGKALARLGQSGIAVERAASRG
ncbi:MAG: NUDIX hydrolase [Rhodothalassiaceae bacterium]